MLALCLAAMLPVSTAGSSSACYGWNNFPDFLHTSTYILALLEVQDVNQQALRANLLTVQLYVLGAAVIIKQSGACT